VLFNSFEFLAFFAAVLAAYLALSRWHRGQNLLLLAASLVFYGWWDWRFLGLMLAAISVDWAVALAVAASDDPRRRKRLLLVSLVTQLTILGCFKYLGFFVASLTRALGSLGVAVHAPTLELVLPVGISFYTFQSIGYAIDVYRRALPPVRRWTDFALFISFFPQLVAGPIERATHLLPQILKPRAVTWTHIHTGLFLINVGIFKKVVLADNLALLADEIFNHHTRYQGLDLAVGALAFTFQIYCDFSAYSDIARGVAKMLGFDLMVNFRLPYFAVSPADFWRRWHISLSTWLRDYLYIPLGGNRHGEWCTYRNLALTMLLGGLWHGAAWNFVLWGAFHGLILIVYRLAEQARANKPPLPLAALTLPLRVLAMFALTVFGWILFRARSLDQLWHFLTRIGPATSPHTLEFVHTLLFFTLPLLLAQTIEQRRGDLLTFNRLSPPLLGLLHGLLITLLIILGVRQSMEFIYFQF
jgi:alginate O-acetyltransferase complex protein AlgI